MQNAFVTVAVLFVFKTGELLISPKRIGISVDPTPHQRKESEAKKKPLKQMVNPQEVFLDVQLNYEKTTILIISQNS
ncbi:hypothetical protein ACFTXL_21175 [Bacillus subtilis]|uniref:hypothetical protein n=1 Tax=Bacillus subtilis TaxID=1423 RepID=UPI001CF9660A|nr:hypothetical protein [Bacillus subtilis]MCB4338743.1 hypothetical protein [Bacillus subtilis]